MGQALTTPPKAITSVVVKRFNGEAFRGGMAEMNGWRPRMEDAHVIFLRETWGFFGVFDGHGGDMCSRFIADRMVEELEKGRPSDDEAITDLMFRLDKEFLDTGKGSGSTGTFVLASPSDDADSARWSLLVGNIGDSRVLLSRADGTMIEGPGTDGALTTDHKPDHPDEKDRIMRTGGYVQEVQKVARVNGDLAVSRSFGDWQHKTLGKAPRDHPVTAEPELIRWECDRTDFVVLVCDGISEGAFPNREVVKLAADELARGGDSPDPGKAAASVCRQALAKGSKDNLSCMVVLFGAGGFAGAEKEFLPGPFDPSHKTFRKVYAAMAEHADLSLAEAVEVRYDVAREELRQGREARENGDATSAAEVFESDLQALEEELSLYGEGPPSDLSAEDRTGWFQEWINTNSDDDSREKPEGDRKPSEHLLEFINDNPHILSRMSGHNGPFSVDDLIGFHRGVGVQVGTEAEVRSAVEEHVALSWDDGYLDICGRVGRVESTEGKDGAVEVFFKKPAECRFWLPSSVLKQVKRTVRVASIECLKPAVEAHSALKWNEKLSDVCSQNGEVKREDPSDSTVQVKFGSPIGITAWLPAACVTDVDEEEEGKEDEHRDEVISVGMSQHPWEWATEAQGEAES